MMPEGWTAGHVSDICRLQNGRGFKPEDWETKGLPIIRIQNLNGSQNFNYFSGVPEKKWLVEPGQMLFAWAGTKGVSFGPTVWRGDRGVLNQHIFKVFESKGVDHNWLYLALRHVTDRIEGKAHGFKATLVHVKKSDIEKQPVAIPPLPEQRKIAEILSTWDQAIETTEALLATARTQKRALMQILLTGKCRFPEFESQPWHEVRLKEFGKCIRGISYKPSQIANTENSDTIRLYRSTNIQQGEIVEEPFVLVPKSIVSKERILRNGDLAVCMSNGSKALVGKSAPIRAQDANHTVGAFCSIFRTAEPALRDYVRFLFQSPIFDGHIILALAGSSINNLKNSDVENMRFIVPSNRDEMVAIANVLNNMDKEIVILFEQLEKLRTEKKALMQQLLTGKRRVQV